MKGLVAGVLFWVLFAAAVPWGAPFGLIAGAVVAYIIWRLDAFDRRLKRLEGGTVAQTAPLPTDVEPGGVVAGTSAVPLDLPAPMPAAPMPAAPMPPAPIPPPADARSTAAPELPLPRAADAERPAPVAKGPPLVSMADLEALLAGKLLAVVGGLALLIGGVFFMGLAFSRGWIGPEARSVLGVAAGAALFATGAWLLLRPGNRTREILAHVLVAVGLAVVTLGLFAATRLYGFVAPELGVGAALLAAAVAAAIAIRAKSQLVAAFGLVAVLAAPPVMGASATLLTIAFLGAALAGTMTICLYISWRWLPPVAFLLAVPQLASYIDGDPNVAVGLVAVVAFWALNAASAAGEEIRRPSQRLSETSATLMVANSAFAVWGGFSLMGGTLEPWRGLYLVAVAAAHFAVGTYFLLRNGERHPFGMLVFGSGIASLTLAVPVQLGASWVPMAWAAEAVALAWVYAQRQHLYAGAVAAVLGTLALGHLLLVEYRVAEVSPGPIAGAVPFMNASGAALAFTTLAAGVAIYLLRHRAERVGLAGIMAAVIALALPRELGGVVLVAAYAALVAGPLLVQRRWLGIPLGVHRAAVADARGWAIAIGERALYASAALAALIDLRFVLRDHLPPGDFASGLGAFSSFARPPFFDDGTLVAAIVVAAALLVAFGAGDRMFRWLGCLAAALMVAYLVSFEVGSAGSVVAWLALGLSLHVLATRWQVADPMRQIATYAFVSAAMIETLVVVAAPDRLVVRSWAFPEAAIFNGGMLAVAAVATVLAARAWLPPRDRDARLAGLLAGASAVYLLSIGTVDLFQAAVGGGSALDDLQKQAQVALSVLWAVLGVAGFVIGLVRQLVVARLFGLGLLAIVTVKVFIVDLAALDVAYRVLSFVALGLLLLGAAYLASRLQPDRATASVPAPSAPGADPPDPGDGGP